MAKFIDKILGSNVRNTTSADDYTEIDQSKYEEVLEEESAETYVKIAEVSNINQMSLSQAGDLQWKYPDDRYLKHQGR